MYKLNLIASETTGIEHQRRLTLACLTDDRELGQLVLEWSNDERRSIRWEINAAGQDSDLLSRMMYLGLNYAFEECKVEKVVSYLPLCSEREIALHRSFGFEQEGVHRLGLWVGTELQNAVCLGILRKDWQGYLQTMVENHMEGPHPRADSYFIGRNHQHDFSVQAEDIEVFSRLSGDQNPIHLDDRAAEERGFPGRIAHGMLTSSVFSRIFGLSFPMPHCIYLTQKLSFRNFVCPGEPLQARLRVLSQIRRKVAVETLIVNRITEQIKVEGEALILLAP